MEKEPRVFGTFHQRALHFVVRFSQVACRGQRPRQGVVSEDIAARIKFLLRESKRRLRILVSRREKERQCAGIPARAVLPKLHLDSRRFVLAATYAQSFRERPLIFGKLAS